MESDKSTCRTESEHQYGHIDLAKLIYVITLAKRSKSVKEPMQHINHIHVIKKKKTHTHTLPTSNMRKPLPDLLLKLWPIQSQQITNRSEFFSNKTANSSGPFNNYTTMATNVPQKTWKKLRIQRPTPYLHGQLKCMQHTIRGIFMSKADESHSHDRRDITS